MDISWRDLNNMLVLAAIVAVLLRILVVAGYGRGPSMLLTFYLPTGALLVFMIRAFVVRFTDVISPTDLTGSAAWGLILATQLVAAVHAWWPRKRPPS